MLFSGKFMFSSIFYLDDYIIKHKTIKWNEFYFFT